MNWITFELWEARSGLYRSRFFQVENTCKYQYYILIRKLLTRFTRFTYFCIAPTSASLKPQKFSKMPSPIANVKTLLNGACSKLSFPLRSSLRLSDLLDCDWGVLLIGWICSCTSLSAVRVEIMSNIAQFLRKCVEIRRDSPYIWTIQNCQNITSFIFWKWYCNFPQIKTSMKTIRKLDTSS